MDNVCTIKGVALITAATIVAEANGFELFKNPHIFSGHRATGAARTDRERDSDLRSRNGHVRDSRFARWRQVLAGGQPDSASVWLEPGLAVWRGAEPGAGAADPDWLTDLSSNKAKTTR